MAEHAAIPLLERFLASEPSNCPGCRRPIARAPGGECPKCGELLSLEVKSLRQVRWTEPGAIPVAIALGALPYMTLYVGFIAGAWWWMLRRSQLPLRMVTPETWVFGAAVTVIASMNLVLTVVMWRNRRRLLRARLWVRVAAATAAIVAAWGPLMALRWTVL